MNDDHVICVFCSSDSHVSDDLKEYTEQLGSYLGTKRMQVMTGGSEQGLMRSVANGYLKTASASGIRMIIPEVFRNKADKQHPALSEQNIVWVDSFRVQLEVIQNFECWQQNPFFSAKIIFVYKVFRIKCTQFCYFARRLRHHA